VRVFFAGSALVKPTLFRNPVNQHLIRSNPERFAGVLVSDFYAAYDSISCTQQKWILHLLK